MLRMKQTRFTELLIAANGLNPKDLQSWVFCPGMLFQSTDKWWGDHGRRDFPHEGIDFCLHTDRSDRVLPIDHRTRIPVMHDGVVRAMFTDYLGQAVVIEHADAQNGNRRFLSVYAHTKPQENIQPGVMVKEGEIIATIADTSRSKAKILPHLHFTLGLPSPNLVLEPFIWNDMRDPERVTLLNPFGVIDWPCQVLEHRNRLCLEL